MASFMVQLSKWHSVIIVKSKPSCVYHECKPCPSYMFSFLKPSFPCTPQYPFIRASLFDCPSWFQCLPWTTRPAQTLELCFLRAFGPLASQASWAASLRCHGSEWLGAGETFARREGPLFLCLYNGKEKWFMSEYGHILLIKPTQKRQHCNIFQWLFIMNYVSLL